MTKQTLWTIFTYLLTFALGFAYGAAAIIKLNGWFAVAWWYFTVPAVIAVVVYFLLRRGPK